MIDESKLTPAPWLIHTDLESGASYIPRSPGMAPMLMPELDGDPVDMAALELAALARNFLDCCSRRGWGFAGAGRCILDNDLEIVCGPHDSLLASWQAAVDLDRQLTEEQK